MASTQCMNVCRYHSNLPKREWRGAITSRCRNRKLSQAEVEKHMYNDLNGCPGCATRGLFGKPTQAMFAQPE
jgi:hypothetical protein